MKKAGLYYNMHSFLFVCIYCKYSYISISLDNFIFEREMPFSVIYCVFIVCIDPVNFYSLLLSI